MASSIFKCKRGWLITPDETQDGIMVPFFIKVRSKDMFTTTKTVADFLIEEYEDKIVMRRTYIPSLKDFVNKTSSLNSLWHTIFLPYIIQNDENFNVQITLRSEYDDNTWNSSTLSVKPLFTNNAKNEIYAIRVSASNPISRPQYLTDESDPEISYYLEITGLKKGNLNVTYNGYYHSSSNAYAVGLPENNNYYGYSLNDTLDLTNWYSNRKDEPAISENYNWDTLSSGENVKVNFYLDEEENKISANILSE